MENTAGANVPAVVHLLFVGTYEDRTLVGAFASRTLAEREIVRRAFKGEDLSAVDLVGIEVATS